MYSKNDSLLTALICAHLKNLGLQTGSGSMKLSIITGPVGYGPSSLGLGPVRV